jgi:ABC-2 type transport system permease protein
MTRLIRAELLKLRTTQVWFWLLLAALALSSAIVIGHLATHDGVTSEADVPKMFANSNGALIATFLLGVLGITTEFRYQTITPTVLATPSRWAIITAKLISYLLVGIAYAAACIGVELAIALPWLSSKHIDFTLSDPYVRRALGGLLLVFALFAIIGIGIGALLRNQIVAITIGLLFLVFLDNIILGIPGVKKAWPYLPSGAVTELLFRRSDTGIEDVHLVGPVGALVILLLWAFVPALIGAAWTMNRDIT